MAWIHYQCKQFYSILNRCTICSLCSQIQTWSFSYHTDCDSRDNIYDEIFQLAIHSHLTGYEVLGLMHSNNQSRGFSLLASNHNVNLLLHVWDEVPKPSSKMLICQRTLKGTKKIGNCESLDIGHTFSPSLLFSSLHDWQIRSEQRYSQ